MGAREITIGYGQTEASPIITLTSVDDPIEVRVGTVGRPIPGAGGQAGRSRDRREDVAPGEAGELCVRGHGVMAGYYKQPRGDRAGRSTPTAGSTPATWPAAATTATTGSSAGARS